MATTNTNNLILGEIGGDIDDWGEEVNNNYTRLDDALDGVLNIAVSGDRTITASADNLEDEARFAILNVVGGSGGRVFLPNKPALYTVRNGSAADVTFLTATSAVGQTATVHPTSVNTIFCDGTIVYQLGFGSNPKDYIDAILPAAKAYTDATAFAVSNASFPGQTGKAGFFLKTDGTNPVWFQPTSADIAGLDAQLAAIRSEAAGLAIVL